jgi:hypothetical protein
MVTKTIPQNESRFVNEISKSADFIPGLFVLLDKAILGLRKLSSVGATVEVREFAFNDSPALYSLLNGYPSKELPTIFLLLSSTCLRGVKGE